MKANSVEATPRIAGPAGAFPLAAGSAFFEIARAHYGYMRGATLARDDRAVLRLAADLSENEVLLDLLADSRRIDWLADRENRIGNVELPRECVEKNLHSMRAAIDAAMSLPNDSYQPTPGNGAAKQGEHRNEK